MYDEDFSTLIFGRRLGVIRSGCWYQKPWESPAPSPAKPCSKPYQPRLISDLNIQTHTGRKHFLIDRLSEDGHIGRKRSEQCLQRRTRGCGLELRPFPHQNRSPNKKQAYQLAGKFPPPVQRQVPTMTKDVKGEVNMYFASLVDNPVVGNTEYLKYQDCLP